MNLFVLDCSVSAAWCLKDEINVKALAILHRLANEQAIVPSLWQFEMANILTMAERRNRISSADVILATELLSQLPIIISDEPLTFIGRLTHLAKKYHLSAYDAAYLDLAIHKGLPLATLDKALRIAAQKSAVQLLVDD